MKILGARDKQMQNFKKPQPKNSKEKKNKTKQKNLRSKCSHSSRNYQMFAEFYYTGNFKAIDRNMNYHFLSFSNCSFIPPTSKH